MIIMFNPGELNKKIIIQKNIEKTDKYGNVITEWQDYKTVYAKVNSLYGKEYWQAAAQGQENAVVFTLRYSEDLKVLAETQKITQYSIICDGLPYDILSYDNYKLSNNIIKIKAVNK